MEGNGSISEEQKNFQKPQILLLGHFVPAPIMCQFFKEALIFNNWLVRVLCGDISATTNRKDGNKFWSLQWRRNDPNYSKPKKIRSVIPI